MSPLTPYSIDRLPQGPEHFRIVRVAAGRWQDPIRCKLIHRKLDGPSEKHPYRALSYVWGSSSVTDTIYLEGFSFQITLNLSCALRHLRKADEDTFLWVDALCINQQDYRERSLQVGIMQSIYKNAQEVVVFMGDDRGHRISRPQLREPPVSSVVTLHGDERDTSFLTDMFSTCHSSGSRKLASTLMAAACAMGLISMFSEEDAVEQGCLELAQLREGARYYLFECLRAFTTCPWWTRIWVVQEIAVGTAVTIRYGTLTLSWETLVATANVWSLQKVRQVANSSGIEPENLKVFVLFANQLTGLEETRKRWRAEGGTDLIRLLQEFSDRHASDDRDKVYGLLSLAKEDQKYIEPNYELDVLETYRATVLALIGKGGSLSCWAGDQKRKFNRGLPSWIPDWSTAVDNGDKRRMDLYDSYNENSGWDLKIIETEKEYWDIVHGELELLMNSPFGKSGRLPASLNSFVLDYIKFLMERARSLDDFNNADVLDRSGMEDLFSDTSDISDTSDSSDTSDIWDPWNTGVTWKRKKIGFTPQSVLRDLRWCVSQNVIPRSGLSLLKWWVRDVEHLQNETRFEQAKGTRKYGSKQRQIWFELRELGIAINEGDVDMERRTSNAQRVIYGIESIILGPEKIMTNSHLPLRNWKPVLLSKKFPTSVDGFYLCAVSRCLANITDSGGVAPAQLRELTSHSLVADKKSEASDFEISPSKLFRLSYSFQGTASWLTQHQFERAESQTESQTRDVRLLPRTDAVTPERILTMQVILVDTTTRCGSRQFGWTDTKSALATLISWLYLSGPVLATETIEHGEIQLNHERIRQFARTIVGGMCRQGGSYQKVNDRALGPLEEWLRQCLINRDEMLRWELHETGTVKDDFYTLQDWQRMPGFGSDWRSVDPIVPPQEWLRESLDARGFGVPPSPLFEAIQVATDGRVFFLTRDGSMGLGPASMRPGDSIHVLPSGRAHFVLRYKPLGLVPPDPGHPEWIQALKSDRYELIGDCYLHTKSLLEERTQTEEEAVIEGSLPFEILGARYLRQRGLPVRKTVMLV